MKTSGRVWMALAVLSLFVVTVSGQQTEAPQVLIGRAEKARAAGDGVTALREYTEAICILRLQGGSQEELVKCLNERDRIVSSLIAALAGITKRQKEIVVLQRGISKKLDKIIQTDQDIQERVKRNEDRIKNIETELLDAVR